jgi:SlyX protein
MDDDKLIDIETKLAHQEHLLTELNDVITSQQAQVTKLESLVGSLIERVRDMPDAATGAGDEKPPHY